MRLARYHFASVVNISFAITAPSEFGEIEVISYHPKLEKLSRRQGDDVIQPFTTISELMRRKFLPRVR